MKAIVAIDDHDGYSRDGSIPWHDKGDLKWFKERTSGCNIIMGGNTYRSLPKTFKLGNRRLWVLTRDETLWMIDDANITFTSIIGGLPTDAWVCGAYDTLLPYCSEVHFNIIPGDYQCDKKFPWDKVPADCKITCHVTI